MPQRTRTSKRSSKPSAEKSASSASKRARRLALPAYKLLRLKRIKYPEKLPSAWQLTKRTVRTFWGHKKLFLGIAIIYAVLNVVLVQGLSGGVDANALKDQLSSGLGGNGGQVFTGVSVLAAMLVGSGNNTSAATGSYQFIVGLVISLAVIFAARQSIAGHMIRIRDAFYQGMYPLVPFVLVFMVVVLEAIPFLIGGGLFSIVVSTGIAASGLEVLLWGLLFAALTLVSLYMLCSSVFALYIVTLPDMTPIRALKSAGELVRYRRGQVFRKLLFLPVFLLVVAAMVLLPIIVLIVPLASWIFFVLSTLSLIFVHLYMYTVYKALLA